MGTIPLFKSAIFSLPFTDEERKEYFGFHCDEKTEEGHAVPYFTRDVIILIADDYHDKISFRDEILVYGEAAGGNLIEPQQIQTEEGGTQLLYPLKEFAWQWDIVKP